MAVFTQEQAEYIGKQYNTTAAAVLALPESQQQQLLDRLRQQAAAQAAPQPQKPAQHVMSPIGIPVDAQLPSAMAPVIVLYGPPGVGKTREAADAFPNNLYVQSQSDILRFAEQFSAQYPKLQPYIPQHRATLDERTVQQFYGGSFMNALNVVVAAFVRAAQAGNCPYDGITFDEWNTFCKRVYAEMEYMERVRAAAENRKVNVFNAMRTFTEWHQSMLAIGRLTGLSVCFVSHPQYPRYYDEAGDPRYGKLKTPGGPRMPQGVGAQLNELCQEASAVIEMDVRPAGQKGNIAALASVIPGLAPPATPGAPSTTGAPATNPLAGLPGVSTGPATTPPAPSATDKEEAAQDALAELHRVIDQNAPRVYRTALTHDWFRKVRGLGISAEEEGEVGVFGLRQLLQRTGYKVGVYHQR